MVKKSGRHSTISFLSTPLVNVSPDIQIVTWESFLKSDIDEVDHLTSVNRNRLTLKFVYRSRDTSHQISDYRLHNLCYAWDVAFFKNHSNGSKWYFFRFVGFRRFSSHFPIPTNRIKPTSLVSEFERIKEFRLMVPYWNLKSKTNDGKNGIY